MAWLLYTVKITAHIGKAYQHLAVKIEAMNPEEAALEAIRKLPSQFKYDKIIVNVQTLPPDTPNYMYYEFMKYPNGNIEITKRA